MPAAKPKKSKSTKKAAPKKTAKKTPVKKAAPKIASKKPVMKPLHPEATIIRVNKGPVVERPEPRTINIDPKPTTFTHKNIPLSDQIGGPADFKPEEATPRLKLRPKENVIPRAADTKLLKNHYKDTEDMPVSGSSEEVESNDYSNIVLTDPEPLTEDPFSNLLHRIEEAEEEKDNQRQNTIRETTVKADPVANPRSRSLVDEIENPKPFDTKHYHVPIKSRAVKSAGTYLFEFIIILVLVLIFVAILIDAELIETSFELPFDVV